MSRKGFLVLAAATLLAVSAGCDRWKSSEPPDPAVAESCEQEGFDPGTTEYADCVEELSESGQD